LYIYKWPHLALSPQWSLQSQPDKVALNLKETVDTVDWIA
jgi:hypothetical protein